MSYDDSNKTDDEVDIEFDEIKTNSIQSMIDDEKCYSFISLLK